MIPRLTPGAKPRSSALMTSMRAAMPKATAFGAALHPDHDAVA
jgi:hypothetical protein